LKAHGRAVRDFGDAQLVYETKLNSWRNDQKKNTAADGYSVAPPEKPVCPPAKRYIVSDTTTEAIAPILRDNPRGVLLARDEISGWLASFDRYSKGGNVSADAAHWLSMHDGDELTIDRKTSTPPTIFVPSASVCITGGIQPGILAKSMTSQHRESGLMARILFAMPPRGRRKWTEADVSPDTERAVADVFAQLLTLEADVVPDPDNPDEPDLRPVLIEMTPDAKAAWIDFFNEHNSQTDNLSDDESAAWSKLEGYVPRFALVIHLSRWASGDPAVPTSTTPVDVDSVRAAIELVRWFARETFRVYARLGESEDHRDLRELAAWVKNHGGVATARDLTRGPQKYRGKPDLARADLDRLVKAGMARWEVVPSGPGGGKPTDRVRLVAILESGGDRESQ
ncbi:MAG: DUF3987 domain-containing protein, partial [Phycisphaerae bacterium]|nr:DUF3987 domain-containing protein [Phycisphaerae bacterium]